MLHHQLHNLINLSKGIQKQTFQLHNFFHSFQSKYIILIQVIRVEI